MKVILFLGNIINASESHQLYRFLQESQPLSEELEHEQPDKEMEYKTAAGRAKEEGH